MTRRLPPTWLACFAVLLVLLVLAGLSGPLHLGRILPAAWSSSSRPGLWRPPPPTWITAKLDAAVLADLAANPNGMVEVIIKLRPPRHTNPLFPSVRAEVRAIQDAVLAALAPAEFQLTTRHPNSGRLDGWISLPGLAKLVRHPDVVSIEFGGVRLQTAG